MSATIERSTATEIEEGPHWGRHVPTCQGCGRHGELVLVDGYCPDCQAAFAAMPSEGAARRKAIADFIAGKEAAFHVRCPFAVTLRLEGKGALDYGWGHFSSVERAFVAGWDALHPLKASQRPYGLRVVAYKVTDVRTGEIVEPPADARRSA